MPGRVRFLHPPRTGGTSIVHGWGLRPPEYLGHHRYRGEAFAYGCCRNPWDRVVSLYHLLNRSGEQSFREWVLGGMSLHGRPDTLPDIRQPCWAWLQHADFVIRFEDREAGLVALAVLLEREPPLSEHRGATDRRPYPEYYDNETRAVVADRYAEDIEHFGYEFGQPAGRAA